MLRKINSWLISLVDGPSQSEEDPAWRRLRSEFSAASKRGVTLEQYLIWKGQKAFFDGIGEERFYLFFEPAFKLTMFGLAELAVVLLRQRVEIPFGWILDLTFLGMVVYFGQLALRRGFRHWQWHRLAKQLPGEASPAPARA